MDANSSLKGFTHGCKISILYLIFAWRPIGICFWCQIHISFYLLLFGINKQLPFRLERSLNSWTILFLLASNHQIYFWAQFLRILPKSTVYGKCQILPTFCSGTSSLKVEIHSLRWHFYQIFHQCRTSINILPGSDNFLPVFLLLLKLIPNMLVFA